jgi:hypothetical protein
LFFPGGLFVSCGGAALWLLLFLVFKAKANGLHVRWYKKHDRKKQQKGSVRSGKKDRASPE